MTCLIFYKTTLSTDISLILKRNKQMNIRDINEALKGIRPDNHPVAYRILTELKENSISDIDKALIGIRPDNHPLAYKILTQLKRNTRHNTESPFEVGVRLALTGFGISDIWSNVQSDSDMDEAHRGYDFVMDIKKELMKKQ